MNVNSAIFRENRLHSDYFHSTIISLTDYRVYGGGGVYVIFKQ